ncbi:MAG: hypothetical protein ACKVW3_04330 [Phycisphaerales bacterium]
MVRNAGFIIGLMLSLVLHASLGAAFVWWISPIGAIPITLAPTSDAPMPDPVRPGIEESSADAMAWIGSSRATAHGGAPSQMDQAAFTLQVGTADQSAPRAAVAAHSLTTPRPSAEAALREMANQSRTDGLKGPVLSLESARAAFASPSQTVTDSASSQPSPSQAAASEAAQPGRPGTRSDKESDAASRTFEVTPGEVLAAGGLEIKTRRPKWNQTSLVSRSPRNPTIRVTFRADGTVRSASFVEQGTRRLDTGYEEVDTPLINAVNAWTASGRPLRELPKDNPEAGITLTFYIHLRG